MYLRLSRVKPRNTEKSEEFVGAVLAGSFINTLMKRIKFIFLFVSSVFSHIVATCGHIVLIRWTKQN